MSKQNQHILLVDDDIELCHLLAEFLRGEGFRVSAVHDGQAVLDTVIDDSQFDAIVLDIMMPKLNGLEVLQALRSRLNTPVVMLTGRGDDIDRIVGLEMGADDYLGKPCNPRELSARLRAVLRRSSNQNTVHNAKDTIELHGINLNNGQRSVTVGNEELSLTSAEFNVLALLMQSAGEVLSKSVLTEKVLQRKLGAYDRSIDVHVSRVRQKLGQALGDEELIKTVRGAGYQFVSDNS
ncbi:MAG: response regulator [Pseudomonadales bacterium]